MIEPRENDAIRESRIASPHVRQSTYVTTVFYQLRGEEWILLHSPIDEESSEKSFAALAKHPRGTCFMLPACAANVASRPLLREATNSSYKLAPPHHRVFGAPIPTGSSSKCAIGLMPTPPFFTSTPPGVALEEATRPVLFFSPQVRSRRKVQDHQRAKDRAERDRRLGMYANTMVGCVGGFDGKWPRKNFWLLRAGFAADSGLCFLLFKFAVSRHLERGLLETARGVHEIGKPTPRVSEHSTK